MSRPRLPTALLLCCLYQCGGGGIEPAQPAAVQTPPPGAPVALHEWGVVQYGDSTHVHNLPRPASRGVPVIRREAITVDKPVIYAHLLDGADHVSLDVTVRSPGGGIAEHYPLVPVPEPPPTADGEVARPSRDIDTLTDGDEVDIPRQADATDGLRPSDDRIVPATPPLDAVGWLGVDVHEGTCVGQRAYPRADSQLCRATGDEVCEVSELAAYETRDGACLGLGGETYENLFYRLRLPSRPPPLTLTMRDGGVYVRNTSGHDVAGPIFILFGSDTAQSGGAAVLSGVTSGAETPATTSHSASAFPRGIGQALLDAGLTEDEAVAFERAWNADFMRNVPARGASVIYQLPENVVSALAPLEVSPAPREIRRVWFARQQVNP